MADDDEVPMPCRSCGGLEGFTREGVRKVGLTRRARVDLIHCPSTFSRPEPLLGPVDQWILPCAACGEPFLLVDSATWPEGGGGVEPA